MTDLPDGCRQFVPSAQIEVSNEFAVPFRLLGQGNVVHGSTRTYTFALTDTTKIYQIQSISIGTQSDGSLMARFRVDNNAFWIGGFTRYIEFPAINNPALKLISSNVITVVIYNYGVADVYCHVVVNGTKYKKPVGFGQPPNAGFHTDLLVGDVGSTVNFLNDSVGTITVYDYDFKDGSAHGVVAAPSHVYSVAGQYLPTLLVSNQYGSDSYGSLLPIGIKNVDDYTLFTEVDAGALLAVAATQIDFAAVTLADTAYVYYDYLVDGIQEFDIAFSFNLTSLDDGGSIILFRVADQLGAYGAGQASNLLIYVSRSGADYILNYLNTDAAGGVGISSHTHISIGTTYYVRVKHDIDVPYFEVYVYSDNKYSVYVAHEILVRTEIAPLTWQYLYVLCSYGTAGALAATGVLNNLRIIELW